MLLLFWGIVLLLILGDSLVVVVVFLKGVLSASDLEQLTEHAQYQSENFMQLLHVLLYSSAVSMAMDLTYSRVLSVGAPSRGNPSH